MGLELLRGEGGGGDGLGAFKDIVECPSALLILELLFVNRPGRSRAT